MNKVLTAIGLMILTTLASCDLVQPVACTEQFEIVSIEVTGAELDRTYTIANGKDTLQQSLEPSFGAFYTIIDDSNLEYLEGKEVDVVFHGYIGESLAVKESFRVGADVCHVYKVSGKDKVEL